MITFHCPLGLQVHPASLHVSGEEMSVQGEGGRKECPSYTFQVHFHPLSHILAAVGLEERSHRHHR